MLGSIRGKVLRLDGFCALIETAGLGYEVEVPARVLSALQPGQECFLYLHQQIREDAQLLFGFGQVSDRELFRELLKISGIGARTALALISSLSPAELHEAVIAEDVRLLSTVPGIGRKTAERLIVELKDRLKRLPVFTSAEAQSVAIIPAAVADSTVPAGSNSQATGSASGNSETDTENPPLTARQVKEESISALIGLGYKENIALSYVKAVYREGMDTKAVIIAALAQVSAKNRR